MQTFFPRWRRSLLLFSFSLPAVAWAAAPELRYQFKVGADHVYSLHVEANEPRLISTLDGLVTYHVKSATADALTSRRTADWALIVRITLVTPLPQ